mmetsp:Transcript_6549/g.17562  ORF Transcript_6549/g.17562 Transcript_6549/m.17562 type:complete len:521 (+) Transcript_6549:90-1652(+)
MKKLWRKDAITVENPIGGGSAAEGPASASVEADVSQSEVGAADVSESVAAVSLGDEEVGTPAAAELPAPAESVGEASNKSRERQRKDRTQFKAPFENLFGKKKAAASSTLDPAKQPVHETSPTPTDAQSSVVSASQKANDDFEALLALDGTVVAEPSTQDQPSEAQVDESPAGVDDTSATLSESNRGLGQVSNSVPDSTHSAGEALHSSGGASSGSLTGWSAHDIGRLAFGSDYTGVDPFAYYDQQQPSCSSAGFAAQSGYVGGFTNSGASVYSSESNLYYSAEARPNMMRATPSLPSGGGTVAFSGGSTSGIALFQANASMGRAQLVEALQHDERGQTELAVQKYKEALTSLMDAIRNCPQECSADQAPLRRLATQAIDRVEKLAAREQFELQKKVMNSEAPPRLRPTGSFGAAPKPLQPGNAQPPAEAQGSAPSDMHNSPWLNPFPIDPAVAAASRPAAQDERKGPAVTCCFCTSKPSVASLPCGHALCAACGKRATEMLRKCPECLNGIAPSDLKPL